MRRLELSERGYCPQLDVVRRVGDEILRKRGISKLCVSRPRSPVAVAGGRMSRIDCLPAATKWRDSDALEARTGTEQLAGVGS
jgi:hypothetical protein